ncbi:MAG: oxidoreductase, partial [Acidobacteriaceae bacterium]
MSPISRRKLITGGVVTMTGVAGLAAADRIARRFGLIPPDGGGVYGPGETMTYAAQRLIGKHALAREFPRGMVSKT